MPPDIFDRIDLDIFDTIDLPADLYKNEMKEIVRNEIRKEIAKLPIGKLVTQALEKAVGKRAETDAKAQAEMDKKMTASQSETDSRLADLKAEIATFMESMKKKYVDLKNEMLSMPMYQFGGFSPQVNDLNIGDPSTDGNWRIVKSGTALSIQRLESGTWIEKFAVQS